MDQSTTENTGPVAAASLSSNKPDDTAEVDREDLARFQATPEGNRRAVIASLFFLVVALFVGVPVWLKTTATYQAPLPFWDIKALCSRSIKVAVPLTLVSFTDQLNKVDLSTVGSDLATSEDITLRCGTSSQSKLSKKLHVRCAVQTRSATPDEQATVKSALSHATSLNEFLSRVEALLPSDETESRDCNQSGCDPSEIASSVYTISILPPGVHALLKGVVSVSNSPLESAIPVSIVRDQTNRNVIYIVLPKEQSLNRVQLTAYIAKLMNSVMLTVDDLQHLFHTPGNESQATSEKDDQIVAGITQTMTKQLPPSTAYEITVTVLTNADETRDNGNNNNNASATSWHAQLLRDPTVWLQDHVQSAFRSWLPYVDIQFFSQRLHAVNIEHLQPSYISADRKYRYYAQSDVSTLVNHLESYLGAPQAASAATRDLAGTKPGLHLILSVAMPSGTTPPNCPDPLRFHLPSAWSPFTLTNVAVVPQWGGLFFVDAPDPCTRGPSDSTAPEDVKLAHQLISVIRVLLGLPDRKPDLQNLVELRSTGIISTRRNFHTQLDGWFLRRTIESLLSIKVTMTSLVDLLSRFPNMVINDHVAHEVTRSTQVWAQTLDALANARTGPNHTSIHFGTVFLSAQDALESVNSAFFDHSLLGRLYFQEDQKYGIYVPLFLPIGFGILSSTKTAFRILFPRES